MTIIMRQLSIGATILFLVSNHPLFIGFTLITVRIIFSILIFLNSSTAWISYILMVVFLRGSIVIFIYITSISSNELFKFNISYVWLYLIISGLFIFLRRKSKTFENSLNRLNSIKAELNRNSIEIIYKTYSRPLSLMTLFIILYLLLVIVVAVKITISTKAPVRIN